MILTEAKSLAERTLAAIDAHWQDTLFENRVTKADRERIESDLAGLRDHYLEAPGTAFCHRCVIDPPGECPDRRRYTDGLLRTGRVYGVEP